MSLGTEAGAGPAAADARAAKRPLSAVPSAEPPAQPKRSAMKGGRAAAHGELRVLMPPPPVPQPPLEERLSLYHAEVDAAAHDSGCGIFSQHGDGGPSEAVRCIARSLAAGMTRREILATLLTCGDGDALRDVIARLAAVG